AVLPSLNFTLIWPPRAAPSTTWLLVRISPSSVRTTPEPSPVVPWIITTEGCTFSATSATVSELDAWANVGLGALTVVTTGSWNAVATAAPTTPPPTATAARASPAIAFRPAPLPVFLAEGGGGGTGWPMIMVSRRGKPPAEGGVSPNWLQPPVPCSRGSFAFIVISLKVL